MIFNDRTQAGALLAEKLLSYKSNPQAIVLGLPRGGVVTAHQIATILNLPLDIIITRKIGAPGNPELALGAIAQDGSLSFNTVLMEQMGITIEDLRENIDHEQNEIKRRLELYRKGREPLILKDKVVILVDDGIATGATMRAGIKTAKALNARKIIVAVPVMPKDSLNSFQSISDECICLVEAPFFLGVGAFYKNFDQVEDSIVIDLLQ